jgi:ubiquinone/menaquinone biosynthesis C-methylase UbiE
MRESVLGGRTGDILEIAVGDGKNFRYYDRKSSVIAVDLSPVMLSLAGDRAKKHALDFRGEVADAARLKYADGSFDHVVCTLGGCTFGDPDRVFAEMRRVLRPSGRALFVEHVRPKQWFWRMAAKAITPISSRVLGCHPDRDTEGAILGAGFRFERVERAFDGMLLGAVAERV